MPSRRECANAIRVLAMDAVQLANSGHPGMPMGMADIAQVLWHDFLRVNPANPTWYDRDRFILSNGHGAMLLYAALHLSGFDLSIEDLKQFRQLHSRTPGHPEYGHTSGVETTTGPLGQGLATAVGMAIAEKQLSQTFNREKFNLVDHYTYVFAGDGDLMEGVSHEACSLAGTLGLGKLIVFYDDNGISIDGDVSGWFTDNTPERFHAYHWHVIADVDGHDPQAIKQAIDKAHLVTDKPSLICCKTIIGYGAPTLAGDALSHGAPLGEQEIAGARKILNWPYPPFEIPESIYSMWNKHQSGATLESQWKALFAKYETAYPALAREFERRMKRQLPRKWDSNINQIIQDMHESSDSNATRKLSLSCLNKIAPLLPELNGGSADLSGSNCTKWDTASIFTTEKPGGNYIEYGVREFAMSAITNGLSLHGGFIPFAGTFLVFSDYARNAVRLAALMQTKSIFVYTHDSIGLGEDGPTHQPVEQLPSLRLIPGLNVWRPCDGVETAVAWRHALENKGPSCLLLTRQKLAHFKRTKEQRDNIDKGGYILWEISEKPQAIILATGSEVEIAVEAAKLLQKKGINVRVVSIPCCELFKSQSEEYQHSILPTAINARVAVEAAKSDYWYQFVGLRGRVIGIDAFGCSAPYKEVYQYFELQPDYIVEQVEAIV